MSIAKTYSHKVISNTAINDSVFILRIERKNINFKSGQHINVGTINNGHTREYSILSGENDDYLEILVKEVLGGLVSPVLKGVQCGGHVLVEEPFGYFSLSEESLDSKAHLFIATGTGIAPFNSFIRTYNNLNYKIVHGIRFRNDKINLPSIKKNTNYSLCVSGEKSNYYNGRVTQWLDDKFKDTYNHIYLCGNRAMINDSISILKAKGIENSRLHAEVYY